MLVLRMNRPTQVTRSSSRLVDRCPAPSLPSTYILRNFFIRNSWLLRPIHVFVNNIGPVESRFTRMAITMNSGSRTSSAAPASVMSKARLTQRSTNPGGPLAIIRVGASP